MTISEAIDIYREYDEAGGFDERGYPACIGVLDGVVAIADESGNGSSLEMYRESDFVAWMIAARDGLACDDFDDMREAVNETRPTCEITETH